ncbi:MAG: zinc metallopeptidase [Clostridia bacterium]|nr:zinc metallopeptidase [Clostridia bacterium]
MYYFFYDYWYLILCVPPLILALFAQFKVRYTYKKYSQVMSSSGLDGAGAARTVLSFNDVPPIAIGQTAGELTDHYDPRTNSIALSQNVYGSHSVAALGIAAHEAGHAVQYAVGYGPMKVRGKILPVASIGSQAGIWLAVLGSVFAALRPIAYVGVGLYIAFVLFELITLPVEINASNRAVKALEACGVMAGGELVGAKKVLRAAALTYVAALASSVGMLLRLLIMLNGRDRD